MSDTDRFPLILNGIEVWEMDELRKNYDSDSIAKYYSNGTLFKWLLARVCMDEINALECLDTSEPEFLVKLKKVFIFDTDDKDTYYDRQKRLTKLMRYTADGEIFINVDKAAFEQNDIDRLLNEQSDIIFLCGQSFIIPLDRGNVKYIGINNPIVIIQSKKVVDFKSMNIRFENVLIDSEYRKVLENFKYNRIKTEENKTKKLINNGLIENKSLTDNITSVDNKLVQEIIQNVMAEVEKEEKIKYKQEIEHIDQTKKHVQTIRENETLNPSTDNHNNSANDTRNISSGNSILEEDTISENNIISEDDEESLEKDILITEDMNKNDKKHNYVNVLEVDYKFISFNVNKSKQLFENYSKQLFDITYDGNNAVQRKKKIINDYDIVGLGIKNFIL